MFKKNDPYRKRKFAAIFILVLFLGSSLAIGVIDKLNFFGSQDTKNKNNLNDVFKNTFHNKTSYSDPSTDLRNAMLGQGWMIFTYTYAQNCNDSCNGTVSDLQYFISDKPDSYLVVLKGNNETLQMENAQDTRKVNLNNSTELLENYCQITNYRPYTPCVTRGF